MLRSSIRHRGVPSVAAALLPAALVAFPAISPAQQTEQRTMQGDRVAIHNLVGTIRAEAGTGSQVVVDITRNGPDASELRLQESSRDGTRILAVVFPGERIIYPAMGRGSSTTMSVSSDGIFGGGDRDRRRIRVTGTGDGFEAHADLRVRIPRGQTISLHLGVGDVSVTNVEGNLMIDVAAADVTTEGTSGVLALDAGSGRATVRNARGRIALDLGSGPVSLADVDASTILVDAGSGSITGTGLTARELSLDTGSGNVELASVSAETVMLDAGSGNIDVELSTALRSLSVDAGSGNITVRVPENIGATIEAETGSGGIDVDLPLQVRRMSRDHMSGTIGNGQAQVRIDAGSGRIRIVKSG